MFAVQYYALVIARVDVINIVTDVQSDGVGSLT